jgi:hypothetical protein
MLSAEHVVPIMWKSPEFGEHRNEIGNVQPLCSGTGGCNNTKRYAAADYRVLVKFSNPPKAATRWKPYKH